MRFKTTLPKEAKHTEPVSCVVWSSPDELITCGDDHQILRWNLVNNDTNTLTTLSSEVFPTEIHAYPRVGGTKRHAGIDLFLLTSSDGKFHLLNNTGRIEKSVEAHKGAVLDGKWSHDGAGLVTGGEDGMVKIWSRSGMLRSTLAQSPSPIYSVAWSPSSDSILYTVSRSLVIKPLQPNSRSNQWKAHEGVVLCVSWNSNNNLIVSGGEDMYYRVWDGYGRLLFRSLSQDSPITALSWAPDGQLFAVGAFNTLRLCDKAGWSHSLEKPSTGSVLNLSWSSDGTQVAGACGNGQVIFAHVIEKRLEWKNLEAVVTGRKTIIIRNVLTDGLEKLEFRDRIIKTSLEWGHLVVGTTSQLYVYSSRNWNTPIITDLREGAVSLIVQAERHFLLVDGASVLVLNYEGRSLCSPKWPGMRADMLSAYTVSVSNDTIAIRDKQDEKSVHLFDSSTGKGLHDNKPWTHVSEILQLCLSQTGPSNERKLAVLDKNRDVFLVQVRMPGVALSSLKLGVMQHSLCWNDATNMLVGLRDSSYVVWYYTDALFVDRDLLPVTTQEIEMSEFGKNAQLVSFLGNKIVVRRSDGALIHSAISAYPALLHSYANSSRWDDAVRLCRFAKLEKLWGCLAAMATFVKDLNTAEIAYAAINQADKVYYLHYIKELGVKEVRQSEMALLSGNQTDAEGILVQAGLVFRAIIMHIQLYNWDRALELAIKYKTHVDTVLAFRQKYLQHMQKQESNQRYMQYNRDVEVHWETVKQKIALEYEKESTRGER